VVVGHLESGPAETALHVEALVVLAAVEDGLVAADLLGDEIEGLDEAQAELLALLVLGDGDVLDVADEAEVVDALGVSVFVSVLGEYLLLSGSLCSQFALGQQGAGADDAGWRGVGVLDDNDKVGAVLLGHPVVALLPLVAGNVADGGQDAQAVEEARVVVGAPELAQLVAGGQLGLDLGGEVLGGEEFFVGHWERRRVVVGCWRREGSGRSGVYTAAEIPFLRTGRRERQSWVSTRQKKENFSGSGRGCRSDLSALLLQVDKQDGGMSEVC
jgi:hypothetical protein